LQLQLIHPGAPIAVPTLSVERSSARPSYIPFAHTFLRQFSGGFPAVCWRHSGSFLAAFWQLSVSLLAAFRRRS